MPDILQPGKENITTGFNPESKPNRLMSNLTHASTAALSLTQDHITGALLRWINSSTTPIHLAVCYQAVNNILLSQFPESATADELKLMINSKMAYMSGE